MHYDLRPPTHGLLGTCRVRLSDDLRKCVVFIGASMAGVDDGIDPKGTGFLVVTDDDAHATYLVTARHLVEPLQGDPIAVRFNVKGGGGRTVIVEEPWAFHPSDNALDVAVVQVDVPDWADCIPYSQFGLIRQERIEKKNIGAGDLTYTVGLWKFMHGAKRNQPFVYTGHIGLMPDDERVPIVNWRDESGPRMLVEAYLVQGEPLDGASGSPVFVRWSVKTTWPGKGGRHQQEVNFHATTWLLGIQQGAWFATPSENFDMRYPVKVSRGVNVVIPAAKIVEVLDQPTLTERRAAEAAKSESWRAAEPTR